MSASKAVRVVSAVNVLIARLNKIKNGHIATAHSLLARRPAGRKLLNDNRRPSSADFYATSAS